MKNLVYLLVTLIVFIGCSPEPEPVEKIVVEQVAAPEPKPVVVLPKFALTSKLISKYGLSPEQICDLQLYTSNDIKLKRKVPAETSTITKGTLVVNKQDKNFTIIIKKGTPCIAIKVEGDIILVKFSEDLQLNFMHSAKKKDLFLLTANKWQDAKGTLFVNGKEYQAIGTSGQTYLMLNKTDVDNSNEDANIIEGISLPIQP